MTVPPPSPAVDALPLPALTLPLPGSASAVLGHLPVGVIQTLILEASEPLVTDGALLGPWLLYLPTCH